MWMLAIVFKPFEAIFTKDVSGQFTSEQLTKFEHTRRSRIIPNYIDINMIILSLQ